LKPSPEPAAPAPTPTWTPSTSPTASATAAAIIEYRREHGPFQRPEDLLQVRGIGPKKLAKMRDRVTVR
jgi:competence ComEA-like helix-hairpin-helix protein